MMRAFSSKLPKRDAAVNPLNDGRMCIDLLSMQFAQGREDHCPAQDRDVEKRCSGPALRDTAQPGSIGDYAICLTPNRGIGKLIPVATAGWGTAAGSLDTMQQRAKIYAEGWVDWV